MAGTLATPPAQSIAPVRRRLFFSFHYQADIRRTCIVRQSWRIRPGWEAPIRETFFDNSMWEKAKVVGAPRLKQLIRAAMDRSSVTCVLAGEHTWSRPFVRFEIAHSLFKKNGLMVAHIHNVRDPQHGTGVAGPNPLHFMALEMTSTGQGRVWEYNGSQWQRFDLMRNLVPWPRWLPKVPLGALQQLSVGAAVYDYALQDGHGNLGTWAHEAFIASRRGRPLP